MRARPLALSLLLGIVNQVHALERYEVPMNREAPEPWDAGASCTVTYGNTCTGWLWVWSDYEASDIVGIIFDPCCGNGRLVTTQAYFWTAAPSGWGYTGVLALNSVVAGCPGTPYDSFPLLPPVGALVSPWADIPPGPVALTYTWGPGVHIGLGEETGTLPTDHPAAGPTGPQACGLCYPSTRPTHTFYFGKPNSPLCPGSPLSDGVDGVCNAEALFWSAQFSCAVSAEPTTWGSLKNLYR